VMTSDEPPGSFGSAASLLQANVDHRIPDRSHEFWI
jgi:hypothetical protein